MAHFSFQGPPGKDRRDFSSLNLVKDFVNDTVIKGNPSYIHTHYVYLIRTVMSYACNRSDRVTGDRVIGIILAYVGLSIGFSWQCVALLVMFNVLGLNYFYA